MSQSPYDTTMYIDADCEIVHEDIATVFDELNGNDMVFHTLPVKQNHSTQSMILPIMTNQNTLRIVGCSVFIKQTVYVRLVSLVFRTTNGNIQTKHRTLEQTLWF